MLFRSDAPLASIRRGVALIGDDTVLVQDESTPDVPGSMAWTMHTRADITIFGNRATLKQDGQEMTALILSPPDAIFQKRTADPCNTQFDTACKNQHPNTGVHRLMIVPEKKPSNTTHRITVLFSSDIESAQKRVGVGSPLNQWRIRATLKGKVPAALPGALGID